MLRNHYATSKPQQNGAGNRQVTRHDLPARRFLPGQPDRYAPE